jgi:hypothetical protein
MQIRPRRRRLQRVRRELEKANMSKKFLTAALLGLATLGFNGAQAHGGGAPKHGGVVQTSNDLSFELVGTPAGALIYVEDHGKPMAPAGLTGKLTVLNGAEKTEAELVPAGDKLEAKGVKLVSGSKAVATMTTPAAKAITVRFTVK